MTNPKLIDVVSTLRSQDAESTIYVREPWSCESEAIVARAADGGGVPPEAAGIAASYFLDVFLATEFLAAWRQSERGKPTPQDECDRLIHYAIHDE